MIRYIASKGERLDTIVYKHYGTLEVFAQVLKLNARLKPILDDKDIVYLPDIKIELSKEIKW
ncbi:MAG: tail protein X [Campylobacteraceae bacterium]|jgi:phage tail protein X|nr:tail protein X [Campylobacteraceae bacterium]